MKQDEKERKFHEGILRMLYPPPSPQREHEEEKPVGAFLKDISFDHISDDLEETNSLSPSDDDNGANSGDQKLTRAQRKRLRKKKLKESASKRRKFIGPLLPDAESDENHSLLDATRSETQNVRRNASVEPKSPTNHSGEPSSSSKQSKLKNRRKAKKLAREILMPSSVEKISERGDNSRDHV